MSYEGALLSGWFSTDKVKRSCREMADKGGERMTTLTKEKTPVDTEALRLSIYQKVTVAFPHPRGTIYESGCETNLDYAPHVEWGTGLWGPKRAKYLIVPRDPNGWLTWINPRTGKRVFAKRVMHPGSPGAHMFALGAALTEAEFERVIAGPIIAEWAREQERSNHTFVVVRARL